MNCMILRESEEERETWEAFTSGAVEVVLTFWGSDLSEVKV